MSSKFTLFPAALVLSILGMFSASAQTTMSLDQAVQYAWNNHANIRNAQISIADAEAQIMENKAIGLPQVTGSVNYQRFLQVPVQALPDEFVSFLQVINPGQEVSREVSFVLKNSLTLGLNVDALLFDGSYLVALRAARAYREYVQQDLQVKKRELANQVKDAYVPLLLVDANLDLLDKNLKNLESFWAETKALVKEGFAEQLDADRLELSFRNLQTDRESLVRQRTVAENALKFAMGYPLDQPLDVDGSLDSFWAQTSPELLNTAFSPDKRPELALVDKGLELAEMNIDRYKMGYYPSARAFGGYQHNYQGNTSKDDFWAPSSFVGVGLSIPIFDGFSKKAKIQRAQLEVEKNQNLRMELLRGISLEVETAKTMLQNAQKRLQSQNENVKLAERIYETARTKYKEGVGSSLEITQAEQSMFATQANYMQAMYEVVQAWQKLSQALGN